MSELILFRLFLKKVGMILTAFSCVISKSIKRNQLYYRNEIFRVEKAPKFCFLQTILIPFLQFSIYVSFAMANF